MRPRTGFGGWAVGMLVGMQLLGWEGGVLAEEKLRAGTKELSLAGGFSFSHNVPDTRNLETVRGFDALSHVGYVLTDEAGGGFIRGNFELLAEPTLIHLDASKSATIGGLAVLGRWVFAGGAVVRPYLEAGVGVLGGRTELRQTTCDVNFILQGGPGLMLFVSEQTALTIGYRFQHLSNGSKCAQNLGLNSSLFIVGVSYFFP